MNAPRHDQVWVGEHRKSWVAGPPIQARAAIGDPDKPGHDEKEDRSQVSSQSPRPLPGTTMKENAGAFS
jgi:hypothetical protein